MDNSIPIQTFIAVIRGLPADAPVHNPKKWYRTQKEHWIGWLREYDGRGAYARKTGVARDARYAYNHVVEAEMLIWLIDAAGLGGKLDTAFRRSLGEMKTLMQKSGAIRRRVPWEDVAAALWSGLAPPRRHQ